MNNLQIEYFISLAKSRNFTITAKEFNVTQPSISKKLSALEKEIGFKLFTRSNRRVDLTYVGSIFLNAFEQITELYNNAIKEANNAYINKTNILRIGYLEGMEIESLLNKMMEPFNSYFPNIEYQIECHSPSELGEALYNNELDLIITLECLVENNPNVKSSIISTEKHLLFVPISSPILNKKSFSINDFENETIIALNPATAPGRYRFFDWCAENNFNPKKVKYVPNVESQMLSVEVGLGLTIANSLFRLYNNPLLKIIELKTFDNIYMVWKKDSINLLTESFANLASQMNKT